MSNNTSNNTFSFATALRGEGKKSAQAKEIAILAKNELQTQITVWENEIKTLQQLDGLSQQKATRDAAKQVNRALGNVANFSLDDVKAAVINYENTNNLQAKTQAKIDNLQEEIRINKMILAFFPEDVETIEVPEEK